MYMNRKFTSITDDNVSTLLIFYWFSLLSFRAPSAHNQLNMHQDINGTKIELKKEFIKKMSFSCQSVYL